MTHQLIVPLPLLRMLPLAAADAPAAAAVCLLRPDRRTEVQGFHQAVGGFAAWAKAPNADAALSRVAEDSVHRPIHLLAYYPSCGGCTCALLLLVTALAACSTNAAAAFQTDAAKRKALPRCRPLAAC